MFQPLRIFAFGILVILFGGNGFAWAADTTVIVTDLDGDEIRGTFMGLESNTVTLLAENEEKQFAFDQLRTLKFPDKRSQIPTGSAVMCLANGDRLMVKASQIDDLEARVSWQAFPGWPKFQVPLETISAVIEKLPAMNFQRRQTWRTALGRNVKADLADLKNGDQVQGEFLGLDEKTLQLETPIGETPIERAKLGLLTMNRELIAFPKIAGAYQILVLSDGTQLTTTNITTESDERCLVTAAFGAELELLWPEIVSIRFFGDKKVPLSGLQPSKFTHQPFLAGDWPHKTNLNVLGSPLQMDGQTYPTGLGCHSRSELTYDLNGEYENFSAVIGVDDAAGRGGSVVFEVLVDGQSVFQSSPQTANDKAVPLPKITVANAKRLTLRVGFGEFGDVKDYANWCDAVLIRK